MVLGPPSAGSYPASPGRSLRRDRVGGRRRWRCAQLVVEDASNQAMNGLTAAVALVAENTSGKFGAGTIAPWAMLVNTLRWRDSQAPISAATLLRALLWRAPTAPM